MLKVLCLVLAVLMGFSEQITLTGAVRSGEIVRLHVIASGDTQEEQRVKLCVRDAILEAFSETLSGADSAAEALSRVEMNLADIENVAREAAQKEGYFGPVRAMTGVYPFPDRVYEGVMVPKGEYRALRVVLGEGEGKNWWCILYPALCLSISSADPVDEKSVTVQWNLPDILRLWFAQPLYE